MVLGLACALAAAVAYGAATVLQAVGAGRTARVSGLDPRLLLRLLRSGPYLAGLLLDAGAFVLTLVALRRLPVYVVQSAVSANLAVVAVLAWLTLGGVLRRGDRVAVAAVAVGLVLVAASAGPGRPDPLPDAAAWSLLAVTGVLALGVAVADRRSAIRGPVLGLVAGLLFGVVAVATRGLSSLDPVQLVREPAAWALAGAGIAGQLLYPSALQRGPLTATSATVVAAETLVPAAVAAVVLGDRARPGWLPAALAGLALVLAGAISLGRRRIA